MMDKTRFIVNPVAGRGAGEKALPEINRWAAEKGFNYEVVATEYPEHAIQLAYIAVKEGVSCVVAVGGDGTANEVLNGLMKASNEGYRDSWMGVIGIGRGNDFAFAFGIPAGLEEGMNIFTQNNPRLVDIGIIAGGDYPDGRYFGNGVGIGFDAVVGFEAAKLTHLHGFANYVVAALRTIFLFFHAPLVKIDFDGQNITQPSLMVSIMNGRRMGGGFMMAPQAENDDGLLNLCIAGQMSRLGILKLIPQFMKGTQATHPKIITAHASNVHVEAVKGDLPTHADGETICVAGKELTIRIIKQPIRILCG